MNGAEYRAYREEQEYIKSIQSNLTAIRATEPPLYQPSKVIRPKESKNAHTRKIRKILESYTSLKNELDHMRAVIQGDGRSAGIVSYGKTRVQNKKKRDLSDTIVDRDEQLQKYVILLEVYHSLYWVLYDALKCIPSNSLIYIMKVFVHGKEETSRAKTNRIIRKMVDAGIELPRVEQL